MCVCASHHIILVLQKDAELLEKGHDEHQQLLAFPVQGFHQELHDVFVPHLQLYARVLRQVQQQIQRHYKGKILKQYYLLYSTLHVHTCGSDVLPLSSCSCLISRLWYFFSDFSYSFFRFWFSGSSSRSNSQGLLTPIRRGISTPYYLGL